MIIIVCGLLGSGKTLYLTYLASLEQKVPIYANFNIKVPKFKLVNPSELEHLTNGLIEIDEAYSWFDSRTSGSAENRYLTNRIAFNSRKRGLTVVVSAQLLSSIDVRFRTLAEIIVLAVGFNKKVNGFLYYVTDRFSTWKFVIPFELAEKLFKMYDTLEIEKDSTPTEFEPDRLNKFLNNFVKIVEKEYGTKGYSFSRKVINDILLDKTKKPPSRKIVDMVHARLQRKKIELET